ncbi:MAG TPA: hypothetical protein VFX48_09980 [Saprospiraceae bacterium]|nr:hypothetical protein [Saprospiraceae bacterium]
MRKYWLISLLFLALAGAYYGYRQYNKPHQDLQEVKADYSIAPEVWIQEFDADETAALNKYLNKVIEVNGEISEIQTVEGKTIWILSTGNPLSNIQCEMDPRFVGQVGPVQTGSKVTVQGICSGKLMDVVLNQAVCKKP